MRRGVGLVLLLLLGAGPAAAPAQETGGVFGSACLTASSLARDHCLRLVEAVRILGPRTAVLAAGASPVPALASTLGMRIPGEPRASITGRITAGGMELPGLDRAGSTGETGFAPVVVALDLAVGAYHGLNLAPTIGGLAAIDLLGSLGWVRLPGEEGFAGSAASWGVGARVGLLRESFTAPGVSLSAMYRGVGDIAHGDAALAGTDGWLRLAGLSGWSLRVVAGKRWLGVGLTAGAGHDSYAADASVRLLDPAAPGGQLSLRSDELRSGRSTLFLGASYTLMILHASAELGWHGGGSAGPVLPTTGRLERASYYGSLALRLSL